MRTARLIYITTGAPPRIPSPDCRRDKHALAECNEIHQRAGSATGSVGTLSALTVSAAWSGDAEAFERTAWRTGPRRFLSG